MVYLINTNKKGGQLTALILAKTHRIRIFSSRGY
ncbi:hypothetical protein AC28_4049, partial [Escherichia coli 1-250-04_S3_C2]